MTYMHSDKDAAERYRLLQAKTICIIFERFKDDPEAREKAIAANIDKHGKIIPWPLAKIL